MTAICNMLLLCHRLWKWFYRFLLLFPCCIILVASLIWRWIWVFQICSKKSSFYFSPFLPSAFKHLTCKQPLFLLKTCIRASFQAYIGHSTATLHCNYKGNHYPLVIKIITYHCLLLFPNAYLSFAHFFPFSYHSEQLWSHIWYTWQLQMSRCQAYLSSIGIHLWI